MATLKSRIQEDVKTAMRARDSEKLATLRMTTAAIKQREVDERIELDDAQVLTVIEKMVKQRRESIEQYRAGGRDELADKEASEIEVLKVYLPEPMSAAELEALVDKIVNETGASGMADMGRVMGQVKQQAAGRADMSQVSGLVKARLSG
ncbi:MAG: GatB/YqeY domain-containing protein [Gammaproteobacteria bacterium]|nr:GatB/YqeY domain-containing protein [Gammaproteobacteria bacterium]NND61324.1 GatB/YqeY domain-containing protein [Gammaproteobacteria bacterium]